MREEVDIATEVYLVYVGRTFHDDGIVVCLPHQTNHLCVSHFAKDYYLCLRMSKVGVANTLLQVQNDRTRSVNDVYVVLLGNIVCAWRLAVCTKQYTHIMQSTQVVVVNSDQSHLLQPIHFLTIVHYVSKAKKLTFSQLFFGSVDGARHSETKTTMLVYGNLQSSIFNHFTALSKSP